jgi:hypothetical protein
MKLEESWSMALVLDKWTEKEDILVDIIMSKLIAE